MAMFYCLLHLSKVLCLLRLVPRVHLDCLPPVARRADQRCKLLEELLHILRIKPEVLGQNKRIAVDGQHAAGRLLPDANITMIDQGTYISYGGCGIPYFVGGDVQQMNGLRTTNAGVVRDEAFFTTQKNVKTFCHTRALSIDRRAKTVTVENTETGEQSQMPYDKLVIATGSSDELIVKAIRELIQLEGGIVVTDNSKTTSLALPIGGLMANDTCENVAHGQVALMEHLKELQCPLSSPIVALAFMQLPVIPELKITDKGLFDVMKFEFIQ